MCCYPGVAADPHPGLTSGPVLQDKEKTFLLTEQARESYSTTLGVLDLVLAV